MAEMIHPELMRIALDRVEGFNFERFCNEFYPALVGKTFVPLGGVKDGGADAFDALHEEHGRATSFYQASVGVEVEAKIRQTVQRLREFKRDPRRLTFLTSRIVKYLDTVESDLSDELECSITIRDGAYLASHVNEDPRTRAAFDHHLRHHTDFLKSVTGSHLINSSQHVREPAVYVFLSQELERREGDDTLTASMTDSLIWWALEDTDPDLDRFMTLEQIRERIRESLPTVMPLIEPRLARRLKVLSGKQDGSSKRVRWYRAEDKYCLPYETRMTIASENRSDEALRLRVLDNLEDRVRAVKRDGLGDIGIREAAEIALLTLQLTFEREGLEFAAFLARDDEETHTTITDSIAAALDRSAASGKRRFVLADAVFDAVRGVLYDSVPDEREYLHKLSRTYTLLFTLNTEPRLMQYFQDMTGDFYLYVGTDQIVRALSEHYLAPADQMTKNTLLMAARAGATMVLTEPVLEEVVWHLRTSDMEFRNVIREVEPHVTYELARNSPMILVRAYLYARMNPKLGRHQPPNWPSFLQQFADYPDLHKSVAFDDVRSYLQRSFSFIYRTRDELAAMVESDEFVTLSRALSEKKKEELAMNDALMALAVYGNRKRKREKSANSEFGYRTWWLTNETAILRHTQELVSQNSSRYILRPDFLLNFLTLAPAASESRRAFADIFPTLLGMTLGRRMPEGTFKRIIEQVEEAQGMDDARRGAAMAKCADKLKSDFEQQYLAANESGGSGYQGARIDAVAAEDRERTTDNHH